MATVVPWPCRHQAAMAYTSAGKAPQPRPWRGKSAGALGAAGAMTALGGTPPHNAVAPISLPAAGGLRGCSQAAGPGPGRDEARWRRGIPASRMRQGETRAAGGGEAGAGRLPTGIDTALGPPGGSSPTTRPQAPRSRLPTGHEAPQCRRISRPAVGRQESTALPLFPAVGALRRRLGGFPSTNHAQGDNPDTPSGPLHVTVRGTGMVDVACGIAEDLPVDIVLIAEGKNVG